MGAGYAPEQRFFSCDGLAIRVAVKLLSGDEDLLVGTGDIPASIRAETSGELPGAAGSTPLPWGASCEGAATFSRPCASFPSLRDIGLARFPHGGNGVLENLREGR